MTAGTGRWGLLADVHANLPALEVALSALRREAVDGLVVAGDLLGYGAFPNECVARLAAAGARCVLGNHDLLVLDRLEPAGFPPYGVEAAARTRAVLGRAERTFLAGLPTTRRAGPLLVAHGSPEDPEEYVATPARARALLDRMAQAHPDADTLVLGHTHRQWVTTGATSVHGAGRHALPAGARLVNPGSVGQSRQRERRPAVRFAVLDLDQGRVDMHRAGYDVERSRAALRAWQLPGQCLHDPPSLRRRLRRWRRSMVPMDAR